MPAQTKKFNSFPEVTVGTIFSESWGWEQTNVNFYEVVSRTEKMVTIREIGQKTVKEETAMSSYVVADATMTSENERHFTSSWA